jgi:hypothetical protein
MQISGAEDLQPVLADPLTGTEPGPRSGHGKLDKIFRPATSKKPKLAV